MGRHDSAEIYELGQKDLLALAEFLADKPFFMGVEPSLLDASAYGFLETIRLVPTQSLLYEALQENNALLGYCERMRTKYYLE